MTACPIALRTNSRISPLGIDTCPEFSWLLPPHNDLLQSHYQVQVAASVSFATEAIQWDSGEMTSSQPYGVTYKGLTLSSSKRYYWRVRFADQYGTWSEWSLPAWFETAKLHPDAWRAKWIGWHEPAPKGKDGPVFYLRHDLHLNSRVLRARAYVSALGWYRFLIDGVDITGPSLVPRWTALDHVVEYQVYDVTEHLCTGKNKLCLAVGDGRFSGHLGGFRDHQVFGNQTAVFAQIEVELEDGSSHCFTTNSDWLIGHGRIQTSDPMHGEHVDLRISDCTWLESEAPPSSFTKATEVVVAERNLIAEETERVGLLQTLPAKSIYRTPSGKQVVDFGQNFAGLAKIRLHGPSGNVVKLTYSEVVSPDGEIYPEGNFYPLGKLIAWQQQDEVILNGEATWYEPWFTIRGFRYLEIDGLEKSLSTEDVEGMVLSSTIPYEGNFECSNAKLNQLVKNIRWSLISNFTDTPTDCPTRERSGWTGDIQVFSPTATFFTDSQTYLRRYLRNLALDQQPDGRVPNVIPAESSKFSGGMRFLKRLSSMSAGWGDASIIVPWNLWQFYGDFRVLGDQYQSMQRWLGFLETQARTKRGRARWFKRRLKGDLDQYIIGSGFHFGEWLRPGEYMAMFTPLICPSSVVATAYYANSARMLAEIAKLLGKHDDHERYLALAHKVRTAWRAAFIRKDGRIGDDKQDDYVRALAFELVEPGERDAAMQRLVDLIEEADFHLGTGFLSTPLLLHILSDNGRADVAWKLLLQTSAPSWLHAIEHGATTTWETWDGFSKKGLPIMSHNHYAFGVVASWLYQKVAGITPVTPGYGTIRIEPLVGGGLTHANAWIQTPYGRVSSSWSVSSGIASLAVEIPSGSNAEIKLGDGTTEQVGSGSHQFQWRTVE